MPHLPKLFKKPWDKVASTFELQEYGVGGGKGWSSLTEPTSTVITKAEASQYFKPNSHYRVIARAIEGDHAGQFSGILWEHFEPHKGLMPTAKETKETTPKQPKDATDIMDAYVTEVDRVLTPIVKLNETMAKVREAFAPKGEGPASAPGEERDDGDYTVPPLEFDGKAPWMMHPYVVHTIAEEIKGVIDFGAKRMEQVFGGGGLPPGKPEAEEKEEPLLPSISKYRIKEAAPTPPPGTPPAEATEETETEEEEAEAPLLPEMPKPTEETTEIPGLGPETPIETPKGVKEGIKAPQPPSDYYMTKEKKEKKTTRRKTK